MLWWLLGCCISLGGSIGSTFGNNVQKWSFVKENQRAADKQRIYFKQPLWLAGFSLVFLGGFTDFVALSMAAQSLIAACGPFSLAANVFFAHYWLGEALYSTDIIGTLIIIAGSTLSIVFGNHEDSSHTMHQLKKLYASDLFIIYASVVGPLSVMAYVGGKRLDRLKYQLVEAIDKYSTIMSLEFAEVYQSDPSHPQIVQAQENIVRLETLYNPYLKIHPICFSFLSGVFGSSALLFGKSVAELFRLTMDGDNQFRDGFMYVFLTALAFCLLSQMHFFAICLTNFDAMYVIPVFKCFFLTLSTLGGACYFHEFNSFDQTQCIFFPLGLLLNLMGVFLLSSRKHSQPQAKENNNEKETSQEKSITQVEDTGKLILEGVLSDDMSNTIETSTDSQSTEDILDEAINAARAHGEKGDLLIIAPTSDDDTMIVAAVPTSPINNIATETLITDIKQSYQYDHGSTQQSQINHHSAHVHPHHNAVILAVGSQLPAASPLHASFSHINSPYLSPTHGGETHFAFPAESNQTARNDLQAPLLQDPASHMDQPSSHLLPAHPMLTSTQSVPAHASVLHVQDDPHSHVSSSSSSSTSLAPSQSFSAWASSPAPLPFASYSVATTPALSRATSRNSGRFPAKHAPRTKEVIVSQGSTIYRLPLPSSAQNSHNSISGSDELSTLALSTNPTAPNVVSTSFISPVTGIEYKLPREKTVFPHIRDYIRRTRARGVLTPSNVATSGLHTSKNTPKPNSDPVLPTQSLKMQRGYSDPGADHYSLSTRHSVSSQPVLSPTGLERALLAPSVFTASHETSVFMMPAASFNTGSEDGALLASDHHRADANTPTLFVASHASSFVDPEHRPQFDFKLGTAVKQDEHEDKEEKN